MKVIEGAGEYEAGEIPVYVEQLRSRDFSFGTYSLPAESVDTQSPHSEDEIYVVVSGRATLTTDTDSVAVGPGAVVFIPAHEPHRFTEVTEDLTALVFFAPPEYSRSDPDDESGSA